MSFATSLAVSLAVSLVAPVLAAIAIAGALEGATAAQPTAPDTNAAPATPPPMVAIRRPTVRLSGDDVVYPRTAVRAGISEGKVVARLMIDEMGNVYEVIIVSAEPPGYFDQVVIDTLKRWKLRAYGDKYFTEVESKFKLNLK